MLIAQVAQNWLVKKHLKFHKQSIEGERSRYYVINKLVDLGVVFIYHQDQSRLIQNAGAFDALMCALTAFDVFQNQVEPRPEGFPKTESFIAIPLASTSTAQILSQGQE